MNSQRSGTHDTQECRIQRLVNKETAALDLRVSATPLTVDGESFTVFAMRDTTDEKRRQVLEQLFFHDALNSVAGLRAVLDMWPGSGDDTVRELGRLAREYAYELAEAIHSQRDLAAAERGDLRVHLEVISASELLHRVTELYQPSAAAEGKRIASSVTGGRDVFQSDRALLTRVLGNLIKNAIEGSVRGQTVTVTFHNDDAPTFTVHNDSVMPEAAQAQVFQRSFSTKGGAGRGVGTYSVKLLAENYLRGTVAFRSTSAEGTTFIVRLPPQIDQR